MRAAAFFEDLFDREVCLLLAAVDWRTSSVSAEPPMRAQADRRVVSDISYFEMGEQVPASYY